MPTRLSDLLAIAAVVGYAGLFYALSSEASWPEEPPAPVAGECPAWLAAVSEGTDVGPQTATAPPVPGCMRR